MKEFLAKTISVLLCLAGIGAVLKEKGDYDDSLLHLRKCLSIYETCLGKFHNEAAATYNTNGSIFSGKAIIMRPNKNTELVLRLKNPAPKWPVGWLLP